MVKIWLMVSGYWDSAILLVREVFWEAFWLAAFRAPIEAISVIFLVTQVVLTLDSFSNMTFISKAFGRHFVAIIGAYSAHSFVSFVWVLLVSVFVIHERVILFRMYLGVFVESVCFLPVVNTISISRILRLSIFSCRWVVSWVLLVVIVLILLLSWAPTSMLFYLNLHLETLLFFSFFLLLCLLVLFYLGSNHFFWKKANTLVKDIQVHLNNLRVLHERWKLRLIATTFISIFIIILVDPLIN